MPEPNERTDSNTVFCASPRVWEQLEERVLFDAAVVDFGDFQVPEGQFDEPQMTFAAQTSTPNQIAPSSLLENQPHSSAREIVFVDFNVEDLDTLLAEVNAATDEYDIVFLDPSKDGLGQIADYVRGRSDLAGIHILAHGSAGELQLGFDTIAASQLETEYSDTLAQIGRAMSESGDILLYGCDIADGDTGTDFVEQFARLTAADVAASTDKTGNAALGGDWNLEFSSGLITTEIIVSSAVQASWMSSLAAGAPIPSATFELPDAQPMINEPFTFDVQFQNAATDPAAVGYAPYIDLIVPDGVNLNGANFLGTAVGLSLVGEFDAAGDLVNIVTGDPIMHPLTGLAVTGGTTGERLYTLELPFGSYVQDQPIAEVEISAVLASADGAVVGTPMNIQAIGGFALGCDPLDNAATDAPIIGAAATKTLTPVVINLEKQFNARDSSETATGPNYPVDYTLVINIADGETVNSIDIRDVLPDSFVYVANTIVVNASGADSATGLSITETPTPGSPQSSPTNDFLIEFDSVTGSASENDILITYTIWVDATNAGGDAVIDASLGDMTQGINDASISALYGAALITDDDALTDITLEQKSTATQKSVSIVNDTGAAGASPGDTLEYTLLVQISDFFEFSNLRMTDTFSDGQLLDTSFAPTFLVNENGVTTNGTFSSGTDFTSTHNLGVDGTTDLSFDLHAVAGTLTGDLFADSAINGGTTVEVRFRTVIQDAFTDTFPSGDPSVDLGDILTNLNTVTGQLPSGQLESDSGSTRIEIVGPTVTKSVYAINGDTSAVGEPIGAGITTTYRLTMTLPVADAENLTLTDYLPLPIFNALTLTTFNTTLGPTSTPPPAGVATYGALHTLNTIVPSATPTMTVDGNSNSVNFDFGSFDDPLNQSATIDILFTVVGEDVLMADGLSLTNQVFGKYGSTNAGEITNSDLVFMTVAAPNLNITKGAVSTSADSPTFISSTVGPVPFADPGASGPSFAGGITSTTLNASPIDSNLSGVDAGDWVKFALVVENTGTGDGFNIIVQDTVPPEFLTTASTLNLELRDGDGNLLSYLGSASDLFGAGLEIVDPGATNGAIAGRTDAAAAGDGSNIIVITYDLQLAAAVAPGTTYTNTATITEYGAVDGGLDHTAGSTKAQWSDVATITTPDITATKAIVATSEIHTGVVGGIERAAIGEIVRYQLAIEIPEGTLTDFNLLDRLPAGLQFLDDGTATVAFVSNGAGITSTNGTGSLTLGLGTSPSISGNAITSPPMTSNFFLADDNVGSNSSLSSDQDSYASGTDPFFKLGTIVNADNDADAEFVVVEFNAIVLNNPGSNDNNDLRNNYFQARLANSTVSTSNTVGLRITEPSITNLAKTASPTTGDAGDVVDFVIRYSASNAANRTTAFDARVLDTLPPELALDLSSITVSLGGGAATFTNNSTGNTIDITVDTVPRGGSVEIRFQATLQNSAEPGDIIASTANLTYTSLPGSTGTAAGTSSTNTTGSTTPGASGSNSGERNGGAGSHNDYVDSDSATVSVPIPQIAKTLIGTGISTPDNASNAAVIGETIQYELLVTVPEGTTNFARIIDTLDAGMSFVSLDSIVASSGLSSATVDLSDAFTIGTSFTSPTLTIDLGSLENTNRDNATAETIRIRYTVVVDNVASNQGDGASPTQLNNSAVFGWTQNGSARTTAASSADQVEVIEPSLNITKNVTPANVDGDDSITYTIEIHHEPNSDTHAYDVEFLDAIPSSVVVDFATGVTASHSSTGNIKGLFELAAGGVLRTVAGSTFDLLLGETVTITITGDVTPSVSPGDTIVNNASIAWTSLDGNVTGERNGNNPTGVDDYSDSAQASNTVPNPQIDKSIARSQIESTSNGREQAVIGETIQYRILVDLPESTIDAAAIVDQLDLGLVFVSLDSVTAYSNGLVTTDVTSSVGAFANTLLFAPTVTGNGTTTAQQLTFDFSQITNADVDNGDREQLELLYTVRVANTAANQNDAGPGTLLNNVAHFSWENGGSTITTATSSANEVEVLEPDLTIQSNPVTMSGDAGDTVTYTLGIGHSTISDTDAFDVTFSNPIPSDIDVNFSTGVTVTHSRLGDITSLFELTASGILQTRAGASFDVLLNDTVSIEIDGIVETGVQPTEILDSTATICWTSLDGTQTWERDGSDGALGVLNDYCDSDSSRFTVDAANLTKELVRSEIEDANNTRMEVTIGEQVQYRLTIAIPEGTLDQAEILDTLDLGLEFVSLDSIEARSGSAATTDVTSSLGSLSVPANFAPSISGDGSSSAQQLTFDLGDLVNSNTDNVNAETIVLTYTVRVLNVATNTSNGTAAGTRLDNVARFQFDLDGNTVATADQVAATVEVIEPDLQITKQISDATPHLGQTVTYTVTISHTSASDADAHNLVLRDLVPTGLTLNLASLNVSGATIASNGSSGNTIDLVLQRLNLGDTATITYSAVVSSSQSQIGATLTNSANTTWTTLPDGITSGTGGERDGDGGSAGLDNYRDSAGRSAVVTHPLVQLTKTQVGSAVPASSGTDGNFDLTYDLAITSTGNDPLTQLSLLEDLRTQYGNAFVRLVPQGLPLATTLSSTASDSIELNASYDGGFSDAQLIDNSIGNTNRLAAGESVTIRIIVEVDPNATGAVLVGGALSNQAAVAGTGEDTAFVVNDLSDDPTNVTNADPDSDGNPDDPNTVRLPNITLEKQIVGSPVASSSTTAGNFDVTYEFTIRNEGSTPLEELILIEDLRSQFGGAFVRVVLQAGSPAVITGSNATAAPTVNSAYDGTATNSNLFGATPSLLDVNQFITVQIVVEVDPDNATARYDSVYADGNFDLENQAIASGEDPVDVTNTRIVDRSDDPTDGDTTDSNGDNNPDSPTNLLLPDITLTKSLVAAPTPAASNIANNFDVTYDLTFTNTGNEPLQQLSLVENLLTQYGGAFVRIVPQTGGIPASVQSTTATDAIELNASYDGGQSSVANAQLIDNSGTNTNRLLVGESVTIRITLELDPDAAGANIVGGNLINQAMVSGIGSQTTRTVSDLSDDPTDTDNFDPDADNNPDDPSELRFSVVSLTKQVLSFIPASSGIHGNFDVTYGFEISNAGSSPLEALSLLEDLRSQLGGAFVRLLPQGGEPAAITSHNATDPPSINSSYSGNTANPNIFDATSSLLDVGQFVTVQIVVEIDPDNATAVYDAVNSDGNGDLENQATVTAEDPADLTNTLITDQSDDPTDGDLTDDNADGEPDSSTNLLFPSITVTKAQVGNAVPAASGVAGNFNLTFDFTVKNDGNEALDQLQLVEDLRAQYGLAFVAIVPQAGQPASIMASNATDGIELNASYDGGITDNRLVLNNAGNTNLLSAGQEFTIRVMIEVDPDAPGSIYTNGDLINQAIATGTGTQSNTVASDHSDDPTNSDNADPNSDNDPDDPNRNRLPVISVTKAVIGTPTPAASGVEGNFDVTYEFVISNDGSTALEDISLFEDLRSQFGGAFVGLISQAGLPAAIVSSTATTPATINAIYDGTPTNANVFASTTSRLDVNQSITVRLIVEVDPDNTTAIYDAVSNDGNIDLENQATATGNDSVGGTSVSDHSDDPNDSVNRDDDGDNDADDPTALVLPSLTLVKTQVGNAVPATSGIAGNFELTYDLRITNTGNDPLTSLSLLEDLRTQYGGAFIRIVPQSGQTASVQSTTATDPVELNASFDGETANAELIDNGSGNLNRLMPAESVTIRIVIEVDPDHAAGTRYSGNLVNQAESSGLGDNSGTRISDMSDDPNNFSNVDGNSDSNPDDPNRVRIADLTLTKDIIGSPTAAASGVFGNFDLVYRFTVSNTGSTPLQNLSLVDDWNGQFGNAFHGVRALSITDVDATSLPGLNPAYSGGATENMLDGTGTLDTGESFIVQITVEVDPNAAGAIYVNEGLQNQAVITGADPAEPGTPVSDLSDDTNDTSNADPDLNNNPDDPTHIAIPEIGASKQVISISPSSTLAGVFEALYELKFKNLGSTNLQNLSLVDDLSGLLGPAYLGLLGTPSLDPGSASTPPNLNLNFDGNLAGSGQSDFFDGVSGLLLPGEEMTIRFTALLEADQLLATSYNQAIASGQHPTGTVTDLSDAGSDPESRNPGSIGDTGGEDDPTVLPGIAIAKNHGDPTPAGPNLQEWSVPIMLYVTNVGVTDLVNLTLIEDTRAAFGTAFVGVDQPTLDVSGITGGVAPALNANWLTDTSINMLDGGGLLKSGDSFTVTFNVIVDPDQGGTSRYLTNQSTISAGDPGNPNVTVRDNSDSGTQPTATNSGQPGDTGGTEDPTPLEIADVGVAKRVTSIEMLGLQSKLTFEIVLENTGTVDLSDLFLRDDLASQFGVNFNSIVTGPTIVSSTASQTPNVNMAFATDTSANIFDGSSGLLKPGERITVQLLVLVEAAPGQASTVLENQAQGGGSPVDLLGNPIRDDSGNPLGPVTDDSDSGTDANSSNPGAPGDHGTWDDPTDTPVTFFTYDSYNNFSLPFGARDGNSHPNRLLTLEIPSLAPEPIFSGSARPGTKIVGKIFDSRGIQIGQAEVFADVGGNWMMQVHQLDNSDYARVEFEEVAGTASSLAPNGDIFGYLGEDATANNYAALEPWTPYDEQYDFSAIYRGSASVSLATMHRKNTNPLGFGGNN